MCSLAGQCLSSREGSGLDRPLHLPHRHNGSCDAAVTTLPARRPAHTRPSQSKEETPRNQEQASLHATKCQGHLLPVCRQRVCAKLPSNFSASHTSLTLADSCLHRRSRSPLEGLTHNPGPKPEMVQKVTFTAGTAQAPGKSKIHSARA